MGVAHDHGDPFAVLREGQHDQVLETQAPVRRDEIPVDEKRRPGRDDLVRDGQR